MNKKVQKRGSKSEVKLTKSQIEVFNLLTKQFLTIPKIAIKRRTSVRAVYKILNRIREKGLISGTSYKGFTKIRSTPIKSPKLLGSFKKYIRLHAQEWNIGILDKSNYYDVLRNKGNTLKIDNNTIRLYKDSIEIYSGKDFCAEDEQRATALSFQYWNRFFIKLENNLKVILLKDRKNNINLVNQHYAEVNNELAKEYNKKGFKLHIYTTDDGRLWFTIDYSFNENEAETLHPKTAKQDMGKVRTYFNDIRTKNSYLPSEMKKGLDQTINNLNKLTEENTKVLGSLEYMDKNIKTHFKVLKAIEKAITKITTKEKLTKSKKRIKIMENQGFLTDYIKS